MEPHTVTWTSGFLLNMLLYSQGLLQLSVPLGLGTVPRG